MFKPRDLYRAPCCTGLVCNTFLASVDRDLLLRFEKEVVLHVFRYVDDFLVVLRKHVLPTLKPQKYF